MFNHNFPILFFCELTCGSWNLLLHNKAANMCLSVSKSVHWHLIPVRQNSGKVLSASTLQFHWGLYEFNVPDRVFPWKTSVPLPPPSSSREKDSFLWKFYWVVRVKEMVFYSIAGRANLCVMSSESIRRIILLIPCVNLRIYFERRGILTRMWISSPRRFYQK